MEVDKVHSTQAMGETELQQGHNREPLAHIVPANVLILTWVSLMVLTFVTVKAVEFDLGVFNLFIALGIATAKATLVALYFMHLRWDRRFYAVVFISALLFVLLFISLALMDTLSYQPELIPGFAPEVSS